MFGSKLKTWMENYIGRAKKKEAHKEKPKGNERGGIILESSESLAQSDTGISSSSQQVLSSSATDYREGYSTTTMESEKSGMTQTHTAISLPSPESAYSTGYSTDGASPEATGPPEYYINIRTGKHYFPSPAPTPTSPQPENDILQLHSGNQHLPDDSSLPARLIHVFRVERELSSSSSSSSCAKNRVQTSSRFSTGFTSQMDYFSREVQGSALRQNTLFLPAPDEFRMFGYSKFLNKKSSTKSQLTPLKLFLKSPKNERGRSKDDINKTPTPTETKKNLVSSGKSKKWFKQPFQKFGHRRTDSSDERGLESDLKRGTHFEKNFCYLLSQENSASPRQRNRIKTNPWLPTEPLSSQNFHNLTFSPTLTRNRSCSNTPLQNRKTNQPHPMQNRILSLNSKLEASTDYLNSLEKAVSRRLGVNPVVESSDHSEEDLTLNEMMGTYNESYVYEKETDILSDSDPTDCEDYGTDSEANNGGDERDSHDDELDFIDNGSVIENEDNFPRNTGKCTYYDAHTKKNSFLFKSDRHHGRRGSECRKNSKKDQDSKARREKRRQPRKSFKREDEETKVKKTSGYKTEQKSEIDENVGDLNSSRVLVHRMVANKGSRSAEGTPAAGRRQKTTKDLRESHIGKANAEEKKLGTLLNLYLGDAEADIKYKELIEEAENIFENMRKSPANKFKKEINLLGEEDRILKRTDRDTVTINFSKNTEATGCPAGESKEQETPAKKNPRALGLKLSVETPKKLKRLDFETKSQSSFKAKSSAHSPLDPLGPTLRNFAVFKPTPCEDRKISSENGKAHGAKGRERRWGAVPASPVVPIAFQSVDLGKPLTSYCPQSEPVKRKIYTCSKTYDKLVKRFENKPTIFEENINGGVKRISLETNSRNRANSPGHKACLNGNQGSPPHDGGRSDGGAFPPPPRAPCNRPHPQVPQIPKPLDANTFKLNKISEKKGDDACATCRKERRNENGSFLAKSSLLC